MTMVIYTPQEQVRRKSSPDLLAPVCRIVRGRGNRFSAGWAAQAKLMGKLAAAMSAALGTDIRQQKATGRFSRREFV
ncbi:hypothetical protein [Rhizobium rhizosphaerae]|uniref:hypothetical protein n=1 Tax=Xaviernesmea rhizosphaerae TaxID=1672749 RepID=UPI001179C7A8|nr:hypothetical protein [Xaviernesmea rhizosphaerae]